MRRIKSQADDETDAEHWLQTSARKFTPSGAVVSINVPAETEDQNAQKFVESLGLYAFGMKAGILHVQPEKHEQSACRLNVQGTKRVMLCSIKAVGEFMRRKGVYGASVDDFLRDQRENGISVMMKAGVDIWCATIAPKQLLIVPANFVCAEQALEVDCIGLRWGIINARDSRFTEVVAKESRRASATPSSISVIVNNILQRLQSRPSNEQ